MELGAVFLAVEARHALGRGRRRRECGDLVLVDLLGDTAEGAQRRNRHDVLAVFGLAYGIFAEQAEDEVFRRREDGVAREGLDPGEKERASSWAAASSRRAAASAKNLKTMRASPCRIRIADSITKGSIDEKSRRE